MSVLTHLTAMSNSLNALGSFDNAAISASCTSSVDVHKIGVRQTMIASHVLVLTGLGENHLETVSATPVCHVCLYFLMKA